MQLQDNKAIVTGVSKGIGLETAKLLLEKGAYVAGWSRSAPDFEHERFKFIQTNVTDPTSVSQAYEASTSFLGKNIHILVNNAGMGFYGPMEETSNEEWQMMFETNVNSIFYASKLVVPQMKVLD